MKRVVKINVFLFSILLACGCSNFLDREPTTEAPSNMVFASEVGAESAYNGAFRELMDWFNSYAFPGYSSVKLCMDAMGNDVASFSKYGCPWSSYQYLYTNNATSSSTRVFWSKYYASINNCNAIIANVEKQNEYDGKYIVGKAYFLRAFSYFDLVRMYQFTYKSHKDEPVCPIHTEPLTSPDNEQPLSTVQQVYDLIVSDLLKAEEMLEGYVPEDKDMPSQKVVEGLLARVYLTMENWKQAALYANKAKQGYNLMNKVQFQSGFNDRSNAEWMWCFAQSANQNSMSYVFNYLDNKSRNAGGLSYYNSMRPDPYFRELFQNDDIRRAGMFDWDTSSGSGLSYMTYSKFTMPQSLFGDLVLMRAAEMYLIEAEALAHDNQLTEAELVLTDLLNARNATFTTGLLQHELIKLILIERRKELWGEGFGLFDLLRTEQPVTRLRMDPKDSRWSDFPDYDKGREPKGHSIFKTRDEQPFVVNSPYYLFTIPEKETSNNSSISQ